MSQPAPTAACALEPAVRVAPRGRRSAISGGLLLFLAAFLPAVEVCGDPVSPIQLPMVLPPYLLGGVAAVALMTSPSRAWGIVAQVFAVLAMVFWGLIAHSALIEGDHDALADSAVAIELWWIGVAAMVPAFRRGRRWEARVARAIAVPAILSGIAFGLALLLDPEAMYGMAAAAAGALLLGIACIVWECDTMRA